MDQNKQLITNPIISAQQPHKYLGIFGMLWVTVLLVGTFTSLKTFYIGHFVFSVGAIAYPFVYIFADIFTEVYGYRVTRKIVWTGFACMLLSTILTSIYSFVPNPSFEYNDAFNLIFRSAPIVALGFIVAFFSGELTNSYVVAKMKLWTKGRFVGARLVISTLFGQTVDNGIAFFTAFYFAGWFTAAEIIPLTITTVTFCTVWEIIALPITQKVIKIIKHKEGLDTYDEGTNFNPFALHN
ncbi:MAG: queuosine precursor transporter [Candidatus Uhrbacteria bacterium]|nr:queuosine precursor transporter [Candidatus Uhrbacteria bacterium]